MSTFGGTENVASLVVDDAPRGDVNLVGITRIDSDVVEDIIVTRAKMDVTHPAGATVHGKKQLAGAGTKENAVRIMRIVSKTTDVTAVRAKGLPLVSGKYRSNEKERER